MASSEQKWKTSWHNFAPEVSREFSFPSQIEIYDLTLEGDGEEMPGMVFSRKDKIAIARGLDEARVHRIDAGWAAASNPEDIDAIREIAHLGLNAKVAAYIGSPTTENVDTALKCDVWGVWTGFPASELLMRHGIGLSEDEVIEKATCVTTYAKEHGLNVRFELIDGSRATAAFAKKLIGALEGAKVDSIGVADSYGVCSPEGFRHLIRTVRAWTSLPIVIHCHNDFGLATANALAGLSAGANLVTTTVNGIGERCGLTPLEEVVTALHLLYNIDVGVKYDELRELSELVEKATGPLTSKLKPVVGERAFGWETDDHIALIRKLEAAGQLEAALPYQPGLVGNNLRAFLGKRTGKEGVKWKAKEQKIELSDLEAERIASRIRALATRKRIPSEDEFRRILRKRTTARKKG